MDTQRPFCEDPLWDTNLTWYSLNPDFTTCFHETALVYLPCFLLIVFSPIDFYYLRASKDRHIPWSPVNVLRTVFNLLLLLLPIIDLGYEVRKDAYPVHMVAAAVKIIGYGYALGLHLTCKRMGVITSGTLTFFWGTAVICGAFTFRSVLATPYVSGPDAILPFTTYTIQYPLVIAIFIATCFGDPKPRDINLEDQVDNMSKEQYASFFSKCIFSWFDSFAWKGFRTKLTHNDLWNLRSNNKCANIVPIWDKYWNRMKAKRDLKHPRKKVSIMSTLTYVFGPAYAVSALYQLGYSVFQFASPQIVNLLIDFVEGDEPQWKGYLYTVMIVGVTFINTVLNSQCFYQEYLVGLRVKSALTSAIYRKSVKLSNSGRKEMTVGETTNLMSIDTQKFMDLTLYLNMIWASPLQIALAMYFLWGVLGPSSLAGLAVMILMIPFNGIVAQKMKKYQISQMKDKDRRTKLMDEILNGIKVLKLYAWEHSFEKQVLDIRGKEISALKKSAYLNSFTTFLWTCAPFLVALASFTTFVLSDPNNVLDANTAFVSLTLFNLLRIPLNILPLLIVYLVQTEVSLKRINLFMNADELVDRGIKHEDMVGEDKNQKAVEVEKASFSWDKQTEPFLQNISLNVPQGQLVAVVGAVGTGKSSLLSALLGEMETTSGQVTTRGKIAYVPQQAWIQNATLKYNITFGKKFKQDLYDKVLDSCALLPDLEILPGKDQTEIGEKGINLSGGQKQRISMARSVYNNGDLYLLDDPLSAVDSHVGKHIFDKVIGPQGLLKNKTRILVTHGVSYLPEVDHIIVLKEGQITETGTYLELLNEGGDFANFLIQYLTEAKESEDIDIQTESELDELKEKLEKTLGKDKVERQMSFVSRQRSTLSDFTSEKGSIISHPKGNNTRLLKKTLSQSTPVDGQAFAQSSKPPVKGQVLIEEEKAEEGKVKWKIYFHYARAIGAWFTSGSIFFIFIYQLFQILNNIWLSVWSTDPLASSDIPTRNRYLVIYAVLGIIQAVAIMIGTACVMIGTLNAARKLHAVMLKSVMRSPMFFFDTTPLGRLLNRFSKEVDIVDVTIPMNIRLVIVQSFNVFGTLAVICYANPLFVAVVIPIIIMYYLLQNFYVATARQVKRMESISRSPIYSHFSETISGAPTIRAYRLVKSFVDENEKRVDFNQMCYYPTFASNRWLSVRLETVGNLVILFASLFAVIFRDTTDPGKVGLSLSYALNVTGAMNLLVRMTSEVETNMVSVERISEYQETPQEAPFDLPENDPAPQWPEHGVLKFDNYQTRYREGLDLVLKGISCHILSGEKIGIVGRTGAGKSSLTLALFRIIEAAGGSIYIDGVNIGFLGLNKLRSRLTIIPQDPILFSGSMRLNLDPFNLHSDRDIWRALDHAHLKSYVSNLPGGLQYEVNEGGENLSVGQRQLVCLARALLRKTKVLILDEATAAVDLETDDLIQDTIRKEFADCTVLTIAHRLNTIMDSSRVMVLSAGRIVEFDTPDKLLLNKKSVFYGMAKDAGLLNEA